MKRNSFIEMTKLHNLSGRITYISSRAKQEYLYEVYATEPDRAFWRELAKCSREEFAKSGTNGTCIEARELIIALPESFIHYDHDYLLKRMTKAFKKRYGVDCTAALHHNKRKTNLHIHLIFAERKRLEQPVEKTATRNMFYDEQGKHVRTKKEILDEDGNVRKSCKIIKKGEVYERKIFTVKDERFKQESFLDEVKVFYTDLINRMVIDDRDRLSIFDKNGPYLSTRKVGKNNPKAEEIKADNEIRMEWNSTVDRAIVSGVPDAEIVELKKTGITDKTKESVEKNGNKPELFRGIVRAAVMLLERLISKVLQRVKDIAERKKIPFPVNPHRKADVPHDAEKLSPKSAVTSEESISERKGTGQMSVSDQIKQPEAERRPQPKLSLAAAKYPRLKEIESKLEEQNGAIFERGHKRDQLKQELSECTGIFKGGRRRELQQEIEDIDRQLVNMKKRLSSIVREYRFDSVQAFYKEMNAAKQEYLDYKAALSAWEKDHCEKASDFMSLKERLRQKEQVIKEREAGRYYQTRQNDKGAR